MCPQLADGSFPAPVPLPAAGGVGVARWQAPPGVGRDHGVASAKQGLARRTKQATSLASLSLDDSCSRSPPQKVALVSVCADPFNVPDKPNSRSFPSPVATNLRRKSSSLAVLVLRSQAATSNLIAHLDDAAPLQRSTGLTWQIGISGIQPTPHRSRCQALLRRSPPPAAVLLRPIPRASQRLRLLPLLLLLDPLELALDPELELSSDSYSSSDDELSYRLLRFFFRRRFLTTGRRFFRRWRWWCGGADGREAGLASETARDPK